MTAYIGLKLADIAALLDGEEIETVVEGEDVVIYFDDDSTGEAG